MELSNDSIYYARKGITIDIEKVSQCHLPGAVIIQFYGIDWKFGKNSHLDAGPHKSGLIEINPSIGVTPITYYQLIVRVEEQ